MTGNGVHDHMALQTRFNIAFFQLFHRHFQMIGKSFGFRFAHIYHQRFTAITAGGAINLWSDLFIKRMHQSIHFKTVIAAQKFFKKIIFLFIFQLLLPDEFQVLYQFHGRKIEIKIIITDQ